MSSRSPSALFLLLTNCIFFSREQQSCFLLALKMWKVAKKILLLTNLNGMATLAMLHICCSHCNVKLMRFHREIKATPALLEH